MKVVGFGDFLMHFSPTDRMRFRQADMMQLSFTGAEANVCMALGLWGVDAELVTRIPTHDLALKGEAFLRSNCVRVSNIAHGEGRMGVYFLESGYSLRPSQVIYDRDGTLFSTSTYGDYDWDSILRDADIFYLSGITPSLSDSLLECCRRVLSECRAREITTVFDVNLRPSLCDIERSREIFYALAPFIDCLICNEEHLKQLLSIEMDREDTERLSELISTARERTGIANMAITVRRTPSASRAVIYAAYSDGTDLAVSTVKEIDVVDRVGGGDAFSAGLVYALINHFDARRAVEFAIASGALKHTIHNDVNFSTVREIMSLVERSSCDVSR